MTLAALLAVATMHVYTHPRCSYSFQYPEGWTVVRKDDEAHPCEVRVTPPEDEAPSLWIDAGRGGRERAIQATGFSVVDDDVKEWAGNPDLPADAVVAFGRQKKASRAAEIRVGELEGYRANDVALECEGETEGGKLCPRDIAVLTNGKRWVNLDSYARSEAFELALRTLAIEGPPTCVYTHPQCRFSFRYLTAWTVTEEDEVCAVRLEPQEANDGDPVRIRVGEGGREDGALVAGTVKDWEEGADIHSGKLSGIRAEGVTTFIFLTDGKRWAAIDGSDPSTDELDIVVDSLTLDLPP